MSFGYVSFIHDRTAFHFINRRTVPRDEIAVGPDQIHSDDKTPATPPENLIAVLKSISLPGDEKLSVGQSFYVNDRIQLATGSLSLQFLSGVSVDLVGPVDLELVSEKRAILHRGHLTADVGPAAIGFTIETPYADIIDLGTKFGVNVLESGKADLVVFEGSVDVSYRHPDSREAIARYEQFKVGEAIHIEGYDRFHRIPVIQSGTSSTSWSTGIEETRSPLISKVSDNIPMMNRPIYYSLAIGCFNEDAPSYVDRPYEWNSLPGVPFPEPLRRGDYLRLMNDLKFITNLELKITLRQPANVYVLFDQRVPPPAWLLKDFKKTEFKIGIDEYDPRQLYRFQKIPANHKLGTGPGESVDQPFDIWLKHCPAGGPVHLGSLVTPLNTHAEEGVELPETSNSIVGFSMYGVVVTAPPETAETPASDMPVQ